MDNFSKTANHPDLDRELLVTLIRLDIKVSNLESSINGFGSNFVTRGEFQPVKNIVYSAVGIILTGFVLALLALVVVY